jgi:GNAT superfamily N-acetyltransferase
MSDVVGHLLAIDPLVRVETKSGAVVDVSPGDVLSVRELSDVPVRTSQIRYLEHAAALAWPGTEQHWEGGWLLRAAGGHTNRANSAVPLDMGAGLAQLPAIIDWYRQRGLAPSLALADRLLRHPSDAGRFETRVMVRDLPADTDDRYPTQLRPPTADVDLASEPDDRWLRLYQRDVPIDVLTAVVDGTVTFGRIDDAAVGRAAVTTAPDGVRWVGLSGVRVADAQRRGGHGRRLCSALLAWGADNGATRAYVQVLVDNAPATALYQSMGFRLHHRARYVEAGVLAGRKV